MHLLSDPSPNKVIVFHIRKSIFIFITSTKGCFVLGRVDLFLSVYRANEQQSIKF